jgi:vancomycin resistance protein YoaR
MTTASDLLPAPVDAPVDTPVDAPVDATGTRKPRLVRRFVGAFVLSLLVTLGLAGAAVLAFDVSHDGRILPGVRVGHVDLSGLDRQGAAAALASGYTAYGDGQLVIQTDAGDVAVPYSAFARRPDVEAMVDAAMVAGRTGAPIERAFVEPTIALRGLELGPQVTFDKAALAASVAGALAHLDRVAVDATIAVRAGGITTTQARAGRTFDVATVQTAAVDAVSQPDAPAEAVVPATTTAVQPDYDDAAVDAAKATAERIIADVVVTYGSSKWTIPAATVRSWVSFERTGERIRPVVHEDAIPTALNAIAKKVKRAPVSAEYLVGKGGVTVGVSASKNGRRLDTAGTATSIAAVLARRAGGAAPEAVPANVVVVAPKLTTEEARKSAPLLVRLSSWKTWFPISERNAWGANIWLPAKFINGTVLRPGERFEWWSAVGPITRARGFGLGGVIVRDHTEPTGAIGGGMCSSSTTLFNAALRAGLQMGSRANHSYYINRYPLGLDATVTIKGNSVTTMSFTNDMDHPILIRGFKVKAGGRGWVRYEIWGIPDGRTVSISKPSVSNVQKATTTTVKVSTLRHGVRMQTEYPSNGMDVAVTRVVRDRNGHVLHNETYRSHYQLWNGRIEVGL